jgi:intraflagellar transport protein 80
MTDSFLWHEKTDILVAISDDRIYTWYYPNAVYIDRDLLEIVKSTKVFFFNLKDSGELGKHAQLVSFSDTLVSLRRKDGGMVSFSTSPYPKILLDFCENGKWEKAIKLCRFVKEKTLWAVLASISL